MTLLFAPVYVACIKLNEFLGVREEEERGRGRRRRGGGEERGGGGAIKGLREKKEKRNRKTNINIH